MPSELIGFRERLNAFALTRPLHELANSTKYNSKGYDMFSLGLSVLVTILENMVIGKQFCNYNTLFGFMDQCLYKNYKENLDEKEIQELVYFIMDRLRNDGRPFDYKYMDLELGEEVVFKFHLIQSDYVEIKAKEGEQRFKLTESGLDLLFRTKEMFRELRITISQIYLREQIKAGVFDNALNTVNELYVQVLEVKNELRQLKSKASRNPSTIAFENYQKVAEKTYQQIAREQEVFKQIQALILEARDKYQFKKLTEKEKHSLNNLGKVEANLMIVVNNHNDLFTQRLDLGTSLEEILIESISSALREKLNFEREIIDTIISENADIDRLRQVLHPLLSPNIKQSFNIMKALTPQYIPKSQSEKAVNSLIPSPDEYAEKLALDQLKKQTKEKKWFYYMNLVFNPFKEQKEFDLKYLLSTFPTKDYDKIVSDPYFYSLMITLHQKGFDFTYADEVVYSDTESDNLAYILCKFLDSNPELKTCGQVKLYPQAEVLDLGEHIGVMTNFRFEAERVADYERTV